MESKRSQIVVSKVNGKYGIVIEGQFYCGPCKSAEEAAETLAREARMGDKSYTAPEEICKLAGLPSETVGNGVSECQILPDGVSLKEVNLETARVERLEEFFSLYKNEFERAYADLKADKLDADTLTNLMYDLQTDLAAVGDEIKERMFLKPEPRKNNDQGEFNG